MQKFYQIYRQQKYWQEDLVYVLPFLDNFSPIEVFKYPDNESEVKKWIIALLDLEIHETAL